MRRWRRPWLSTGFRLGPHFLHCPVSMVRTDPETDPNNSLGPNELLQSPRDDLHTRSGAGKRNSPARREADDHSLHAGKPGVCALGSSGQAQSFPQRSRIKRCSCALVAESPFLQRLAGNMSAQSVRVRMKLEPSSWVNHICEKAASRPNQVPRFFV
jgi:hypothetical protein